MGLPHIKAVDLAEHGVVVTFEDDSSAFYDESVFRLHLVEPVPTKKKAPARVGDDRRKFDRS